MVAGSMAGTLYVIGGPGINGRELVASLMGAALIGFTVAHTMSLMVERAVVRDRAERAAEREQRERTERARIEAELETLRAERAVMPDRYADAPPLAPPMYPEERYEEPRYEDRPEPEPVDAYGRTWSQAWEAYHANHPGVVASWAQQNGRWPNCPGPECNPGRAPEVIHDPGPGSPLPYLVDQGVTQYLDEELDPLGYQADPERPWRAFEPRHEDRMAEPSEPGRVAVPLPPREVPVSPGRGWHGNETEVIPRVRDEDQTQVIPAQS